MPYILNYSKLVTNSIQLSVNSTAVTCRAINFLDSFDKLKIQLPAILLNWFGQKEYAEILQKYNMPGNLSRTAKRAAVKSWFENSIVEKLS